jgi:hypothetical protein
MSSQTSTPGAPDYPPPGEPLTPLQQAANLAILKRNIAIGLVVACPVLIALPPRKLDIFTFCLAGTTFISLNHLQKHTTGRSFLNRVGINDIATGPEEGTSAGGGTGLPTERARMYQQMLREKKAAELAGRKWEASKSMEEYKALSAEEKAKKEGRGVLAGLWLGSAKEDWKAQRERKEREAFERGDGVGMLIQNYFQEAMGYKKDDEEEEKKQESEKK